MVWDCTVERDETLADIPVKGKPTGWEIDGVEIYKHVTRIRRDVSFYLVRDGYTVGYLLLRKLGKKLYTPKMVQVDKKLKGGHILALYNWCVTVLGWTIKAGDRTNQQTIGGRYIWNELAKDPELVVMAAEHAESDVLVFCEPDNSARAVYAKEFEIYESDAELYVTALET